MLRYMTDEKTKKFECKGCEHSTGSKCRIFMQSNAMMETLFWTVRRCYFKHMPEREEIMAAVTAAIDTCKYENELGVYACNPTAVKYLIEDALEKLLWLPKD